MNNRGKRLFAAVVSIALALVMVLEASPLTNVQAATTKLSLWNNSETKEYKQGSLAVGEESEKIRIKANGAFFLSAKWSSNNTSICTVEGDRTSARITAHKEGVCKISVVGYNWDGRTYQDSAYVSVYRPMSPKLNGNTFTSTNAYVVASMQGNVYARVPFNTQFQILGQCDNMYFLHLFSSRTFSDGDSYSDAYIRKSYVEIPVTSVSVSKSSLSMTVGSKTTLQSSYQPSQATYPNIRWSSGDGDVAVVNNQGVVTANGIGSTVLTATSGNGKKATCRVTVKSNPNLKKNTYTFSGGTTSKGTTSGGTTSKSTSSNKNLSTSKKSGSSKKGKYLKTKKLKKKSFYSFSNTTKKKTFKKKRAYALTAKDKRKLINNLWKYYGSAFGSKKKLIRKVNNRLKYSWRGACYGMSSTTILNCGKWAKIRTYTKSKGKGTNLNRVKKPRKSKRVTSAITYYQLSQWVIPPEAFAKPNNRTVLKKVYQNARKKYVQMFGMIKGRSGHSIIIKGYKKKKGRWYYLSTYDSNHPKKTVYLKIRKDFRKMSYKKWTKGLKQISYRADFSAYDQLRLDK